MIVTCTVCEEEHPVTIEPGKIVTVAHRYAEDETASEKFKFVRSPVTLFAIQTHPTRSCECECGKVKHEVEEPNLDGPIPLLATDVKDALAFNPRCLSKRDRDFAPPWVRPSRVPIPQDWKDDEDITFVPYITPAAVRALGWQWRYKGSIQRQHDVAWAYAVQGDRLDTLDNVQDWSSVGLVNVLPPKERRRGASK